MADGHHRISPTAYVTAHVWHRLGLPHAALFDHPRGRRLYRLYRVLIESWGVLLTRSPTLASVLEYRHRLIDAAAEAHRPDVLVEIAAGLSRRGATFAERGVRTVEIDLPHMVAAKQRLLGDADPQLRSRLDAFHSSVAEDVLAEGFADRHAGFFADARRPVVVAEGLLPYFDLDERRRLLAAVARAMRGRDGLFLADVYAKEAVGTPLGRRILDAAIRLVTRGNGPKPGWPSWAAAEQDVRATGFDDAGWATASDPTLSVRPAIDDGRSPGRVLRGIVLARPPARDNLGAAPDPASAPDRQPGGHP